MTLDWTKPIETTKGFPATLVDDNYNGKKLIVITNETGSKTCYAYESDGKARFDRGPELKNAPKRESLFFNIYLDSRLSGHHSTLKSAVAGGSTYKNYEAEGVLEYKYENNCFVGKVFHDIKKGAKADEY